MWKVHVAEFLSFEFHFLVQKEYKALRVQLCMSHILYPYASCLHDKEVSLAMCSFMSTVLKTNDKSSDVQKQNAINLHPYITRVKQRVSADFFDTFHE